MMKSLACWPILLRGPPRLGLPISGYAALELLKGDSKMNMKQLCAATDRISWWGEINFRMAEKQVKKLQRRIAAAFRNNEMGKVASLQERLIHSFSAKALAVKIVSSNHGKNTAGVDGIVWKTDSQKLQAVYSLRRRGHPNRIVKRVRYVCYGKTRKQTECDGQTGYTAHTLDGIIDKLVRQIFERMKAVPKSEIVSIRYKEKMDERRALLRSIRADYTKATGELVMLRAEVIKSLRGESAFSQSLLGSLIADAETKCLEVQQQLEAAQAAYDEGQAVLTSLNAQYDDIISWADMYDTASIEAKKMIVNCLIKRVEVYRDYKLHIDFNIDFEQFSMGLDIVWIAA